MTEAQIAEAVAHAIIWGAALGIAATIIRSASGGR